MSTNVPVGAAQYLRMSTEHQQYSLDNQEAAIRNYASQRGFAVVKTYKDSARSGVVLKRRSGLRQLLQDVMSGGCSFKIILVYDVTRWGRFQDNDEAAHYEFMCKSAGVPIHYCAELFQNDGSTPDSLMKALKRSMAAEYSRELGVKVLAGSRRLAGLGFKQGGAPGYGLRRMLVSGGGIPKGQLLSGECKSIATDRVILVPGPAEEVQCVHDIYRMLLSEKRTVNWITRELNRRHVPYVNGAHWNHCGVLGILTHPKYIGWHVYGRTSQRLYTPVIAKPISDWIVTPSSYEPIVDASTFRDAQLALQGRTINKSNDQLLEELRSIFLRNGRVTIPLIGEAGLSSCKTYQHRFGSLSQAYNLIGYCDTRLSSMLTIRSHTQGLREEVIRELRSLFPRDLTLIQRSGRWRSRLRFRTGRYISVLVAKTVRPWKDAIRWQVDPVPAERRFVTLLVRLDPQNISVQDFYLIPKIDHTLRFSLKLNDNWLGRGERLENLAGFLQALRRTIHNL